MKKIIFLGASRYYSKVIEIATNKGYYTIALDRNPKSAGFKVANQSFVCDIIDEEKVYFIAKNNFVDAIIPLNDVGVPVASKVSHKLKLKGLNPDIIKFVTDKEYMSKKWNELGIPYSKFVLAESFDEFENAVKSVGFPCILKPTGGQGGASRGVVTINNEKDLNSAYNFSTSFYEDKKILVESFAKSIFEHSAEVIINNGEVYVLTVADKIKTPLPYRVDKNVLYPTEVKGLKYLKLIETIKNAVKALGIKNGLAHVELASLNDGFVLFELGARCGGGGTSEPITSHVTGIHPIIELIKLLTGEKFINTEPLFQKGCNYHFLTPKSGRIKKIYGLDKLKKLDYVLDYAFFKNEGDIITEVKTGLDRSGFIITSGIDKFDAYKNGLEAEKLIEIEYY